jgi:hypothetical protein
MLLIYVNQMILSEAIFGVALLLLICSLALSAWEIHISVRALDLQLGDIEEHP